MVEGKTPEISSNQARHLLRSIKLETVVGLRDQAIIGLLIYTAVRVGAIAKLKALLLSFDLLCRRCGPKLAEFDVNPLGFSADNGRFSALDGKIVLDVKESN